MTEIRIKKAFQILVCLGVVSCNDIDSQKNEDQTRSVPTANIAPGQVVPNDRNRSKRSDPKRPTIMGSQTSQDSAGGAQYDELKDAPMKVERAVSTPEPVIFIPDFIETSEENVSTFSIDVDTASYTRFRSVVNSGGVPAPESIRVEEFLNFFDYNYPYPEGEHPLAVHLDAVAAPWKPENQILRIGMQGQKIPEIERADSNLVFLVDVSGSMSGSLKMLQDGLKVLTSSMRANDRISIVVYAGSSGVLLDSASGADQDLILAVLQDLKTGGGTNGESGIHKAYELAEANRRDGINRVILCTDGDFNIGVSSQSDLKDFIVEKAKSGIELSVLGFGWSNAGDQTMETLSNAGHGNYAYIDSAGEAEKVLKTELTGTLQTIAKDVKIQVEFQAEKVKSYHLIGYYNRQLANEDFEDDTKDAGEVGSDHDITALYELVLHPGVTFSEDSFQVKVRYKKPGQQESREFKVHTLQDASQDLTFATSVAALGQKLIHAENLLEFSYEQILELAQSGTSPEQANRIEFIDLLRKLSQQ